MPTQFGMTLGQRELIFGSFLRPAGRPRDDLRDDRLDSRGRHRSCIVDHFGADSSLVKERVGPGRIALSRDRCSSWAELHAALGEGLAFSWPMESVPMQIGLTFLGWCLACFLKTG